MSYYKKNLKSLKKYRPELYKKLINYKPENRYLITTSNHPQKYPNLLHKDSGLLTYDNNDPITSVLKDLKSKIFLPVLNFHFGFGLGYELMGMVQNYKHQDSVYVVIDPELEPFYHAINMIDFEEIIKEKRVFLAIGEPIGNMYLFFHDLLMLGNLKMYVKSINIIENKLSTRVNFEYFKSVMNQLKDAVREVLLHFGNDPWDSLIGIENTFLNINEIINNPGIKDLKDKFKGKPGIVVATGPSLNKNIELLRGLENKAVICAADASVKVMKRYKLKPHLVTSLERVIATSKLFEGLTQDDVKDVYLAACPVVRPETYANFPGERIIVYRNFATFKWLEIEKGILNIGASSGNMAFKVLEYLGCDPIILIGQDLAFGEGDVTHATGSTYGEKEDSYFKRRILEVEGNYTEKIKTTEVWYQFLKHYEKDVANFNGTVINATEGGAKIQGTKIMTFKEAIDNCINADVNVIDTIRSSLNYPTEIEKVEQREMMIKKVREAIEYSDEVMDKLKEGLHYIQLFKDEIIKPFEESKRIDDKRASELFQLIQEPMKIFAENKFYEIFMHFIQSYYITSMVEVFGVMGSDIEAIRKNFTVVVMLEDMYSVIGKLIAAMKKDMLDMESKLEENFIKKS
ncbi:MAG: DUF115 domain-containing protein [Deferribacterales bacterium]